MAALDKKFLDFHRQLKRNNERTWFQAHKTEYEDRVKEPMLALIGALQPGLAKISRQLVVDASPSGGSLFRVYRDTRFAKDKTPYKTHTAAHFSHAGASGGRDASGEWAAPGMYLHLEPGRSFLAAGIWHPSTQVAAKIRQAIAKDPKAWKRAVRGLELHGESLMRPPKGIDPEHELIADLKRKDFIASLPFTDAQVVSATFKQRILAAAKRASPLAKFLAQAVGVAW